MGAGVYIMVQPSLRKKVPSVPSGPSNPNVTLESYVVYHISQIYNSRFHMLLVPCAAEVVVILKEFP